MNEFQIFWRNLVYSLPEFLMAVLLLIVAIVLGLLLKNLIIRGGQKLAIGRKLEKSTKDGKNLLEMLGNLGLIIVILLFAPSILERLGLNAVSNPITGLLVTIVSYIPKLLGAALILAIGLFLAKIVKELLEMFLVKIGTDNYQRKLGLKKSAKTMNLSEVIAQVVYFLVLVPIVIAALNALDIAAVSGPTVAILNSIFGMIPNILGAVIILVIGVLIAKIVAGLIYSVVSGSGLNEKLADAIEDTSAFKLDLAKIISEVVRVIIIALVAVEALRLLNLQVLNTVGVAILAYLPNVAIALIALIGGYILGSLAKKFVRENLPDSKFLGVIAHYVIMGLAGLYALTVLGIGQQFILPLFLGFVVAATVASALAFGLGGREFASKLLERLDRKIDENKDSFKVAKEKLSQKEEKKVDLYREDKEKARQLYLEKLRRHAENKNLSNDEMVDEFNERTMKQAGIEEPKNENNNRQYNENEVDLYKEDREKAHDLHVQEINRRAHNETLTNDEMVEEFNERSMKQSGVGEPNQANRNIRTQNTPMEEKFYREDREKAHDLHVQELNRHAHNETLTNDEMIDEFNERTMDQAGIDEPNK